jgi:VWFA-related protein
MKSISNPLRLLISLSCLTALVCCSGGRSEVRAQQPPKTQSDDVLRVSTELVQTTITVLDKKGRFVDGLERGQFELLVDSHPRPINFFERVTAGSAREEQLVSGSGAAVPSAKAPLTVRGRTIVFFIDDMHLSADSIHRTRDMLRKFLDTEMSSKDSVAIVSASGQIGFLQQFTNNKEVLSQAIDRLSPRQYDVRGYGTGSTRMREYDALRIDQTQQKARDDVLGFYIGECVKQSSSPKLIPVARAAIAASCETQVRNSARAVLMQAGTITQNMYASLESLMRSSARMPGRKLAFFISDGFLMDVGAHGPDLRGKLDRIIDAAQRAGVVVYSIDSRGLIVDRVELSQNSARPDVGAQLGQIEATQDALNGLAVETGGRALRNQNYFDRWVGNILDETSNYYVLAWRPDKEEEKAPKFRHVKISITGRPEFTVRAPRGYVDGPLAETTTAATTEKSTGKSAAKTPETELGEALSDYYPKSSVPTLLSLTYLNTPSNQTVLNSSIQIASVGLSYGEDGAHPANVKLVGVILNDKGKIASSFKNQLSVKPLADGQSGASGIIYNHHTPLAPGTYQVRVAVRDEKSGHVGSASQWVVIPDLGTHQLTLSSLLLGGQVLESAKKGEAAQVQLSVDRRFPRSSHLGYWVFIYNAKRDAAGTPVLTAQTQVLRDGKIVMSPPQRKVSNGLPDPERIPYGEDLSLKSLAPGRYDLRVTVTDSIAGTSVTQSVDFEIQ